MSQKYIYKNWKNMSAEEKQKIKIEKENKIKNQITLVLEAFRSGNFVNTVSKSFLKINKKHHFRRSLNNQLIMAAYGTDDARTFIQWRDVGYSVKGAKGFYLWKPVKCFGEKQKRNKETGTLVFDNNGKAVMEKYNFTRFKEFTVFRKEDVTPTEIAQDIKYVEEPTQKPELYQIAQKLGIEVKYNITVGAWGTYSQSSDTITLFTDDVGTFNHELIHAIHKRIDGQLKGGQDKYQEVIAEFCSQVICSIYGLPIRQYSFDYIANYVGTEDKQKVFEFIQTVVKKCEEILNYLFDRVGEIEEEEK